MQGKTVDQICNEFNADDNKRENNKTLAIIFGACTLAGAAGVSFFGREAYESALIFIDILSEGYMPTQNHISNTAALASFYTASAILTTVAGTATGYFIRKLKESYNIMGVN